MLLRLSSGLSVLSETRWAGDGRCAVGGEVNVLRAWSAAAMSVSSALLLVGMAGLYPWAPAAARSVFASVIHLVERGEVAHEGTLTSDARFHLAGGAGKG